MLIYLLEIVIFTIFHSHVSLPEGAGYVAHIPQQMSSCCRSWSKRRRANSASSYLYQLQRFGPCWLVVQCAHLEKYELVNGKDDIPYIMENRKCLKPPTFPVSCCVSHCFPLLSFHIMSTCHLLGGKNGKIHLCPLLFTSIHIHTK